MKTTSRILALLLALLMTFSALAMASCSEDEQGDNGTSQEDTSKEESNFSEFYGTDWINAEKFGMKGDGKTLNDAKFEEYTKYYGHIPLYFPAGTYCFAETLNFPDRMYVKMDPRAELKCVAEEPLEYFITLRGQNISLEDNWVTLLNYAHQSGIEGGTVNCNYKAKCAIGLTQGLHSMFRDLMIMNVLEKGVQTQIALTKDGCYSFENLYIYNDKSLPGTYGVYDNQPDNHYWGVTVVNFETSYYTGGGRFVECSGWNIDMSNVENLTFAEVVGGQSIWIGPSVDTVRYGFKLADGASTSITDLVYITNINFYGRNLQKEYPRTLFWAESPETVQIMATGIQMNWEEHLSFSNEPLPMSSFTNVRLPDGCEGEGNFKNFRDDGAYLRELIAEKEARSKIDFTATGRTNFDDLTEEGVYECNLKSGKGGANLPPAEEKGMLTVFETNGKILQTFYGETVTAHRTFNGVKWGAWIVISQ